MRITIPPQLRQMLEQSVNELCIRSDAAYRKTATRTGRTSDPADSGGPADHGRLPSGLMPTAGLALRSAAMQAGEYTAFLRITATLREQAPEIAEKLGLDR
jgi:hypothetical protein